MTNCIRLFGNVFWSRRRKRDGKSLFRPAGTEWPRPFRTYDDEWESGKFILNIEKLGCVSTDTDIGQYLRAIDTGGRHKDTRPRPHHSGQLKKTIPSRTEKHVFDASTTELEPLELKYF